MVQYTIIANISQPVLYIDVKIKNNHTKDSDYFFLDDLKNTQDPILASSELKSQIDFFVNKYGDKFYKIKHFFDEIPTNHHFFIISEHIDDQIQLFFYRKRLSYLDKTKLLPPDLEKIAPYMKDNYEVFYFNGNDPIKIGVYEKNKRICRFCGKSEPEVHFKNKSHAISESLGNKRIICHEECDECNRRFNETIEQDICNFFRIQLILGGVKGKNGKTKLCNDDISIYNLSTKSKNGIQNTIIMKIKDMPNIKDPNEILKSISKKYQFPSLKYIPQNIYKILCKYVISLIDSQQIKFFKKTIKWINEPICKHRLPKVWLYNVPVGNTPFITIMIRKHNKKELPYCWAILNIANTQILFIIPFCSLDRYKFVGEHLVNQFINNIKEILQNVNISSIKLDGIDPFCMNINTKFKISPDCVEGRDYMFTNGIVEETT